MLLPLGGGAILENKGVSPEKRALLSMRAAGKCPQLRG